MTFPSLSVVTPSYNAAEFIEDAILSVARQQGIAAEHIVVDGASTDSTLEILQRYPGLQWISERDHGQSDAINKGFLRATGDLVGWLNADDYYLPGGLEAIARAAREHPEADVIYGDCVFVDREGRVLRSKVEHEFDSGILMHFGCYIPSTSTFFRRRLVESGHAAGLRLPSVHGLRILRAAGRCGIALSLRAARDRSVSLARWQRQHA